MKYNNKSRRRNLNNKTRRRRTRRKQGGKEDTEDFVNKFLEEANDKLGIDVKSMNVSEFEEALKQAKELYKSGKFNEQLTSLTQSKESEEQLIGELKTFINKNDNQSKNQSGGNGSPSDSDPGRPHTNVSSIPLLLLALYTFIVQRYVFESDTILDIPTLASVLPAGLFVVGYYMVKDLEKSLGGPDGLRRYARRRHPDWQ